MSDQDPHSDPGYVDLSEVTKGLRSALEPQPEGQAFFASPEPAGGTPAPDTSVTPAPPVAATEQGDQGP